VIDGLVQLLEHKIRERHDQAGRAVLSLPLAGSLGLNSRGSPMPNPWLLSLPLLIMTVHRAAVIIAGARVKHPAASDSNGPVTWFRPLKRGVHDLETKIEQFLGVVGAEDQVIFGVDPDSPELELCRRHAAGDSRVSVVSCESGRTANPKIAKLCQMSPLARHDAWVVMDAEAMADSRFVTTFRAELAANDVVTAGYRMVGMRTAVEWLDAIPVIQTLWPGLELVRAFGPLRFTLGACTGVKRSQIEEIGGWEGLGDWLAEDHRLGRILADRGRRVVLSRAVLDLEADRLTWRDYWRHQRRVAFTYRVAAPWGAAGMILTRGFGLSFLLMCLFPSCWTAVLALLAAMVHLVSLGLEGSRVGLRPGAWVTAGLISELVEIGCWGLSWGTGGVWWGGKWRPVAWNGRLSAS
jgi:ceramide glucosyltransferase